MKDREVERTSTTAGLPVAPSLGDGAASVHVVPHRRPVSPRVAAIAAVAVGVGALAALVAQGLGHLIALLTNLSFYGRASFAPASPAHHRLGAFVVLVPIAGGLVVGLMARYGSRAIRGHGIPEAMEHVLQKDSRIPARMTFLKPLSAAIAIGTGGPFGAEGPIIATGGALGSLVGQVLRITADERKTLLAAGAAGGMAATFGSPVSAVLLAIELLLFEYRPRSFLPVALASAAAAAVRMAFVGAAPAFPMPMLAAPGGAAVAAYVAIGAVVGLASVAVTRAVYRVEDAFEKLPVHWMWWPAIGAVAVGLAGLAAPRTLGVGYDNIVDLLGGSLAGRAAFTLCGLKLVSWAVSLGSGTSGGTLAPLLTVGGGMGTILGATAAALVPSLGVDPRMGALVGMAAMFTGASRALLASVVFAFEATRQSVGLMPLLGGSAAAYLVAALLQRQSIMTERIARRGLHVPEEYAADHLDLVAAREVGARRVVTLEASSTLDAVRSWIASGAPGASHQGFPVVDAAGLLVGVVTRRDLFDASRPGTASIGALVRRPPVVVFADQSLRIAADHMAHEGIGRLPVVARDAPRVLVGIITRSDVLGAHLRRLHRATRATQVIELGRSLANGRRGPPSTRAPEPASG